MTDTIASASPDADHAHASNGSAVMQVRFGFDAMTLGIVVSLMLIIATCGVIMGLNLARQQQLDDDFRYMERQEALKERRLMDLEAYAILHGWKRPGDDTFGPTGNVERMVPKK